jgi:hypothetical protein
MRELERHIEDWRAGLRVSRELMEELEGHLREAIDAKLKEGKSAEEAFRLGVAEMGATEAIAAEYLKMERGSWWPLRAAIWGTIVLAAILSLLYCAILIPTQPKQYAALRWLLAPHVVTITFGYVLTYLLGGLAICYAAQRDFGEVSLGQTRSFTKAMLRFSIAALVFTIAGVILGMIWAQHAWGRWWGWDVKETGAAGLLLWQLFFVIMQASRFANVDRTALLSIVGNVVVSVAWFGGISLWMLLTVVIIHLGIIKAFAARSRARAFS